MPTECNRDLFGYEVVEGRQVVAAFDGGAVTSDAGALLLGATDRAIGLVTRFAACFDDGRDQAQVEHCSEYGSAPHESDCSIGSTPGGAVLALQAVPTRCCLTPSEGPYGARATARTA